MTRKHFKMVADTLLKVADLKERKKLAESHAEIFQKSNPRFRWDIFMNACGLGN